MPAVREQATACFAAAVALLPLAQGMPMPPGLDTAQQQAWQHDRALLQQLIDNSKVSRASHGITTDHRQSQTSSDIPFLPKIALLRAALSPLAAEAARHFHTAARLPRCVCMLLQHMSAVDAM